MNYVFEINMIYKQDSNNISYTRKLISNCILGIILSIVSTLEDNLTKEKQSHIIY